MKQKIFIGNIKICTKTNYYIPTNINELKEYLAINNTYKNEIYKENAILYEIKSGYFIDLEMLNYSLENSKHDVAALILSTNKPKQYQLYIDKISLKPYSIDNKKLSKTFYQLKNQIKN